MNQLPSPLALKERGEECDQLRGNGSGVGSGTGGAGNGAGTGTRGGTLTGLGTVLNDAARTGESSL